MTDKTKTITGTLSLEKETTNAVRYREDEDSPGMGAFGQIYLSKIGLRMGGLAEGGFPQQITVTVVV